MNAQKYHDWLIAKLNHHATLDAELACKAKDEGDVRTHELLARSAKEMRLVELWVQSLSPARAEQESKSKS